MDREGVAVSHRAVYHMRQEILRLLCDAGGAEASAGGRSLTESRIEQLAEDWRRKYRTMRPEAACRLFDRLVEEPAPEPARFALFVLAGLERRYDESVWEHVRRWSKEVERPELRRLLARRVASPLLARCGSLLDRLESAGSPPEAHLAFLLAEAVEALRVTEPAVADRVASLIAAPGGDAASTPGGPGTAR